MNLEYFVKLESKEPIEDSQICQKGPGDNLKMIIQPKMKQSEY